MTKWSVRTASLAGVAALMMSPVAWAGARVGESAPAFALKDADGRSHSLEQYKGKTVVLEWVNHGCPFVMKHYNSGNMQRLQGDYTSKGVVWLSVNSSAPGKQGHMPPDVAKSLTMEKNATPTAVLLDHDGTVGRTYGARTTPHMYVVNSAGTLVYAGAIDDTPSVDVEDVPRSRNYVSEALDAVLAGKPVAVASTQAYGCTVKY